MSAHRGPEAAAEFQRVLDHRTFVVNSLGSSLIHLGLGRANALDGSQNPAARNKARAAYQDFLALWETPTPQSPS